MNKRIYLAILLLLPLFLSAITNQFQVEATVDKTILRMPLYSSETDSIYHHVLPVIDGIGYSIDNSLNCSAELSSVMRMRDMEFTVLTVEPEFGLASGDTISVELSGSSEEGITFQQPAGSFLQMYISMFPEMAERENWRDIEPAQPSILYIYVDDEDIEENMNYLVEWKKQRGYLVTLANTTETGTTNTAIKAYIQDAYDNWDVPPEYICLVGDVGGELGIPTWYETWTGHSVEGDNPYTLLAGNDYISDVHIGRLSYNSLYVLQVMLYKTINYEKEPYIGDTSWYNRVLLAGDPGPEGLPYSGESAVYTCINIKELITNNHPYYNFIEVYDNIPSYLISMMNAINQGVSFFTYRGEIGMSGWQSSTANELNNGWMLPFVVTITCNTGSFAVDDCSCSESFLRAGTIGNVGGGIGAIGAAHDLTNTCLNNSFTQGVAYGLYAEDLKTMGAAHTRGKVSLWESYPTNPDNQTVKLNHYCNLMGDPSEEIWIGAPQELVVECEAAYSIDQNSIIIYAENDNNYALEGLYACLYNDTYDEQYFSFTDENGYAFFDISGCTSDEFKLTVSGRNYIPVQEDISLDLNHTLEITNLAYDDVSINGSFEPGEAGELTFDLVNNSINTIYQIEVSVESISDEITIEDGNITIASIGAGLTASLDDITINYLGSGDLSECSISINIAPAEFRDYTDSYIVPLTFLELTLNDYEFSDNNNNIPEPGETVYFDYEIENTGDYEINGINLELASTSNLITISPSSCYVGDLDPEEIYESVTPFTIVIPDEFIAETGSIFTLILSNAAGFLQEIEVVQSIGTPGASDPAGPDEFGYCIYDEYDTGYQTVNYSWIEINTTTALPIDLINGSDQGSSCQVNLPFEFRFYGQNYDELTVCSNGWVAPGYTESVSYMNRPIPGDGGVSPMIAVFWDDLVGDANSGVYAYYNANDHIFVVEWDDLINDYNSTSEETFELIIYDRAYYPTSNGNNQMKYQYKTFNNVNVGSYNGGTADHGQYSTIGIEDQTGTVGLQYTFDNDYFETGDDLDDETALLISGATLPEDSCWLILDDLHYYDENQLEIVLPGETIDLSIDLLNFGDEATGDIDITLSCDHEEFVDLTTSEITVTTIAAGYLEEDITGLSFDLSEDFPIQETVRFNLNFQCNGMSWDYISVMEVLVPEIYIAEETIDFGDVFNDYGKEYVVEIENIGSGELSLRGIDIYCTGLTCDFPEVNLDPGETVDMVLTYESDENGEFDGSITINSNSFTNDEIEIPVVGTVIDPPEIEVQEITDFSVLIDEITDIPISISNIGEENIEVSAHLEGCYNDCADFYGGFLSLDQCLLTDEDFTIEAWVRVDGDGFGTWTTNTLFEQRKDNATGLSGAVICFFVRTGDDETKFVINGYSYPNTTSTELAADAPDLGIWHHYAVTVDDDDIYLYIDGEEVDHAGNNESGNYTTGVAHIDLGAHQYSGAVKAKLNGAMDEVRFWSDVRTEQEINAYMSQVVDPSDEDLIAYWRFDDPNSWDDLVHETLEVTLQQENVTHQLSVVPGISLEDSELEIEGEESENLILQVDASYLELNHVYATNLILEVTDHPEYPELTIPITVTVVYNGTGTGEDIISHNIINQNYPNPFFATNNMRTGTVIEYALQDDISEAEIAIYNIKGQKVMSYVLNPEEKRCGEIIWDGRNSSNIKVGAGVYCYALKANGVFSEHKKMLLLH
ncbi:MAG: DUF1573 domain-containing protein [Candidatus Cloacimonetes bacterium]|nr:DUF1573 domain-containing protein [Candidatus Cloacimonadota bacterium]